jgi:hypothetical protein
MDEEIKACGEPPAVARVVELVPNGCAQGKDWPTYLAPNRGRALDHNGFEHGWSAPGTARFEVDEDQFATAVLPTTSAFQKGSRLVSG